MYKTQVDNTRLASGYRYKTQVHILQKSHLALIFSARVAPKLFMLIGDAGRELSRKELGQEGGERKHGVGFGCQLFVGKPM